MKIAVRWNPIDNCGCNSLWKCKKINYSTNGFSVNIEAINCSNDIDQSESGFEWGREGELFCKSADWSDMSMSCWAEFESVSSFFTSSVMASFCGEASWFV
jgi:hypothetical protein